MPLTHGASLPLTFNPRLSSEILSALILETADGE